MELFDTIYDWSVATLPYDIGLGIAQTATAFGSTGIANFSAHSFMGLGNFPVVKYVTPTYWAATGISALTEKAYKTSLDQPGRHKIQAGIYKFFSGIGVNKSVHGIGGMTGEAIADFAAGNISKSMVSGAIKNELGLKGVKNISDNVVNKIANSMLTTYESSIGKKMTKEAAVTAARVQGMVTAAGEGITSNVLAMSGLKKMAAAKIFGRGLNFLLYSQMFYQAAYGIGKGVTQVGVQGLAALNDNRINFAGNYQDTEFAATMRQRSVQSIQSSKLNARRFLGAEASYMHS